VKPAHAIGQSACEQQRRGPPGTRHRRLLEICGYAVTVAESAIEGLDAAKRLRPDVVLCDIGLPDADGFSLAEAHLVKPVSPGAILQVLEDAQKPHAQRLSRSTGTK
jgi:DNA-binding NarL/FixJ family response regulator